MRTIDDLLEAALKVDLDYLIPLSLIESREVYIRLQQEQMYGGYKKDNKQISPLHGRYPGYAESTIRYKESKGQISKHVTLKDYGVFYDKIFLHVDGIEEAVVDSADYEVSGHLQKYYGPDIFGLNDGSMNKFTPVAQEQLINVTVEQLSK